MSAAPKPQEPPRAVEKPKRRCLPCSVGLRTGDFECVFCLMLSMIGEPTGS